MFDGSLFGRQTRTRPSGAALVFSFLVHLLLAVLVWVEAPRLTVGDGSGGPIPITFAGPEALRAALGVQGIRAAEEGGVEIPPWEWPRAALPAVPFPQPVRVAEGTSAGAATGLPDGTGTAVPRGGDITAPEVLTRVIPDYPPEARLRLLEGSVVIETVIDEEGNATEARVVRGVLDSMDAAALAAVRKWRFKPATQHGKPVRVVFRVTVDFKL